MLNSAFVLHDFLILQRPTFRAKIAMLLSKLRALQTELIVDIGHISTNFLITLLLSNIIQKLSLVRLSDNTHSIAASNIVMLLGSSNILISPAG